jgi:peptide/nickel transport system permease protein
MTQYLIRRLLLIPLLLIGITLLDFIFINIAPGDPVSAMLDPNELTRMSPEEVEARREALGLNRPILVRYVLWLGELVQGNLGYSIIKAQPVGQMLGVGIQNTIALMALSLFFSTIVGVVLGVIAAVRPYSIFDYVTTALSFIGVAMPSFFFALILILVGALQLGMFPTSGLVTPGAPPSIWDRLHHMALPSIALSVGGSASILRYTRSSMIEVLSEEYTMTARAKGLHQRTVIIRHALKNALLPVITILGLQIPGLFGGAVIIETIFNIPGMGSIMVAAMNTRDYPLLMGGVLLSGLLVLVSNLIADLAYSFADPRIQY